MKTPPAPASLPLRLKKAIQGKAGKVFLEGVQKSLANALKSIQPRRRPHSTTPRIYIYQATPETTTNQATPPRAMTPEGSLPQEKRHRRRNTVQNVISDAWNSIRSDSRSHSATPQAITPEGMTPQATETPGTMSELPVPGEATQHSVPESNRPETSVQPDHMIQSRSPTPREGFRDLTTIPVHPHPRTLVPNPRPQFQPQPLPEVRGLSDHLRNVAPHSGVGLRVRSSGVYSSSV